jgi:hypothetical protein
VFQKHKARFRHGVVLLLRTGLGHREWVNSAVPYRARQRVRDLAIALDQDDEPVAATWRRVGDSAAKLGLPRPSYPHIRRVVLAERRRRREVSEVLLEVANTFAAGRVPGFDYTLGRLRDAGVVE